MSNRSDRADRMLDFLQFYLASEFVSNVEIRLRHLADAEINALYLRTHTDWNMGETVDVWTAVLLPVIEREWELRCDIAAVPYLGPIVAPELYQEGGGQYDPF